ncbi:MAG TPA: hypothetical protein VGZ02_09010 [Candidatus Baltobacteraceae bacterium]|jgi:hypothetical protein|nr:hypothetical protein [Candidatus Baltobacteraceae bacterium]
MTLQNILERRVAELDHAVEPREYPRGDLVHFIRVLQQVVAPGEAPDSTTTETLRSEDADLFLRQCRLLDRIAANFPQLTDGPLDRSAQYWVATGRPRRLSARNYRPRKSSFISVRRATPSPIGAKPFGVGLFTSTGLPGSYGMWRCYLRGYENSTLHPKPWNTWHLHLEREARVYEIRDATHWVKLIAEHPRIEAGFVYPDWTMIAARWDAVHISLRAVAAAQGVSFATALGPTVAPYWDVESTFWLNWRFTTATLVEVTPPHQNRKSGNSLQ